MKPVEQDVARALTWVQPSALRNEYQLIADDKALASLRWEKAFGSLATAEAADGRWTFKRAGYLRPRVTVRAEGSEADVATLEPGWTGSGVLQLSDGLRYRWANTSFWSGEWAFVSEAGTVLVRFLPGYSRKKRGTVHVEPEARTLRHLSLLLLLGWYLVVLMAQDTAVIAGTMVATTVP
jgi:hypothetical protein